MSATLIMFSPKCAHCGEELPKRANFCVACGKPFHISDESSRPPAEIRPIRPIDGSAKLPAPPKMSSLAPFSEREESKDKAADSWGDQEDQNASSLDKSSVSIDKSSVSIDRSAISQDFSATSLDMSNQSMDIEGGLLAPTETSKRPWIYAGIAAAFLFLLFAWPKSEKKPLVVPQQDEEAQIVEEVTPEAAPPSVVTAAPEPAPTVEVKAKPETKATAAKNPSPAAPKVEAKTEVKAETPKTTPKGPGLLGALQAQEEEAKTQAQPEVKPEPTPEAKPEPKPEPKPDATNNAANEAASFLDEN